MPAFRFWGMVVVIGDMKYSC
uniref:Uncharacterized protein n=1 Tax=Anguilla anguilla TaxID=7936 RepID=A0A0E9UWT5_ANGAN